jgi:hypothetical protein
MNSSGRAPVEVTAQWEQAVAAAWHAIQAQHPDLTGVPLTSRGAGPAGDDYVPMDDDLPAGMVTLTALLHQAAHGLAAVRDVRETSNRGYYHNRAFATLAEEVGLDVADAGGRGWQRTTLAHGTAERYAEQVAQLTAAFPDNASSPQPRPSAPAAPATSSRNYAPATCRCDPPRRIRAAATEFARGPVLCGLCGTAFTTLTSTS